MKDFSPQMTPTFGILFYVKKTKVLTNGPFSCEYDVVGVENWKKLR